MVGRRAMRENRPRISYCAKSCDTSELLNKEVTAYDSASVDLHTLDLVPLSVDQREGWATTSEKAIATLLHFNFKIVFEVQVPAFEWMMSVAPVKTRLQSIYPTVLCNLVLHGMLTWLVTMFLTCVDNRIPTRSRNKDDLGSLCKSHFGPGKFCLFWKKSTYSRNSRQSNAGLVSNTS